MQELNQTNGQYSSMDNIVSLKNTAKKQMIIYGIITFINTLLTILSISLHVTDNYTYDHIVTYLFNSLMTLMNWCFQYYVYKKINPIVDSSDPGRTKEVLECVGCIGFYDTILNFVWFIIAIIIESIALADSVPNDEQMFLIIELAIIIAVSFYNFVMTCKTVCKSYNTANLVNNEVLNVFGVKGQV